MKSKKSTLALVTFLTATLFAAFTSQQALAGDKAKKSGGNPTTTTSTCYLLKSCEEN